ncbi:hypothetical protein [Antribacter gilvus]|uniref:hypothetical protein n=1 Tax=Antribacter gilvus TaxID=2304675 RepID=UPI000F78FB18|nr:hypothetical protein [Antribacter gilvus]
MSRPTGNTPFPETARGLHPRQYAPDGMAVVEAERPIPVRAWIVTVRGDDREVDGDVMAWTRKAVRLRYVDKYGHLDSAWIWANAVIGRR